MLWKAILITALAASGLSCFRKSEEALTARDLAIGYGRSPVETRRKYEGREVIVEGFAVTVSEMPSGNESEGLLTLGYSDGSEAAILCWFTQKEAEPFSRVGPGQLITVQGVFNGETEAELKFCRLIDSK